MTWFKRKKLPTCTCPNDIRKGIEAGTKLQDAYALTFQVGRLLDELDEAEDKLEIVKEALWQIFKLSGADTSGWEDMNQFPLGKLIIDAVSGVRQFREDYEECIDSDIDIKLDRFKELIAGVEQQRPGQLAFNLLRLLRPDLSNQVRHTNIDPYYLDANLPAFWAFVETHWND